LTRGKVLLTVSVLAAIALVIVFNLRGRETYEVETVEVKLGDVVDKLRETGRIELVRIVNVKSPVSGRVKEIRAEAGDRVSQGDLLAIIEPDPNQSLLLYNKKSAVDKARIDLAQRERELERKRELFKKKLISAEELEHAEDLYRLAENAYKLSLLELQIIESQINAAYSEGGAEMADVRVEAPVSGIVIERNIEAGEMVLSGISAFSGGTNLFRIGDPSRMVVNAAINEVDLGKVRPGQKARISVESYSDTSFSGVVTRIAPAGRRERDITVFDAEIEVSEPSPLLRHGMSCDVDIVVEERRNVPYLPVEAVAEVEGSGDSTRYVVYLRDEKGNFAEREVRIGLRTDSKVEIAGGLDLGDVVCADAEKMRKRERLKGGHKVR